MEEAGQAGEAGISEALPHELLILHLIATGIVRYQEQCSAGPGGLVVVDGSYPKPLQRGLDLLNVLRYRRGLPLIKSVVDLLAWCRRPLSEWSLDLDRAAPGWKLMDQEVLLHGRWPSQLCLELACSTDDVEADLMERDFIGRILARCRLYQSPEAYVCFRRWLIEHPVVTGKELLEWGAASPVMEPLRELLREAYVEAPYEAMYHNHFYCCPNCGALLQPDQRGRSLVCVIDRCGQRSLPLQTVTEPGGLSLRRLDPLEQVRCLKRGLLWFVMWPGRAELRLERRLREQGIKVELWPDYDRYDLRVVVARATLAVDVKDWSNPYLLARHVKQNGWPAEAGDQFYYVFPQERRSLQPDYVRAFTAAYDTLRGPSLAASGIKVAFEDDFLREVLEMC
ncbi:MAG: hypothetical protein IRZ31_19685 [Thermogemmatispora sp.]|uniref:restriction endonuclease-related protein n=1 Tax=Thermogemmatispora sp. TaxID=1968838 RepID=UPI002638B46C|nr:hypothetical protein [Thermogemmatispora sp.]MBX5459121.1 hypothetical protein [Thermogemmatispora sp.]